MNYFNEQEAQSLETSMEILEAISELTSCKEEALDVWKDGCFECENAEAEQKEIISLAWTFADEVEEELNWGEETITR